MPTTKQQQQQANALIFNDSGELISDAYESEMKNKNWKDFQLEKPKRFESHPDSRCHETFLRECIEQILQSAVFNATQRHNKVLEWHSPEELKSILDLNLKAESDSDEELMKILNETIKYSVKTGHPYFMNQLFSGVDPYALIGQWLTDALNPSVYTFEVSPVFTLMEEVVLWEMRKIVGYIDGTGDGIFCPGGSIANGYAINCARYKYMPDIKVNTF